MRTVEIVEALPVGKLLLEIPVVAVREELVELVFVGSVGPLGLTIELRRARFDLYVLHSQVGDA